MAHAHRDGVKIWLILKGHFLEVVEKCLYPAKFFTHTDIIVGMRRHAHHPPNPHVRQHQLSQFMGLDKVLGGKAELGLLLRHMHLQQHICHTSGLLCGTFHVLQMFQ